MIQPEVIAGCLQGDRSAQRELFTALAPMAFRVAMRYVRERADAEDIAQNSMARVFSRLETFKGASATIETWAHRIFINESLRLLKKRKSLLFTDVADGALAMIDAEPLATDHLAAADLRQLILRLPEGYRTVFNLHEVEGFSHIEIGEQLAISATTSRSQLARAKQMLRKWLTAPTTFLRLSQVAAL